MVSVTYMINDNAYFFFFFKYFFTALEDLFFTLLNTNGYRQKKNTNWKRYMHPLIHCNTIYNNQDMETT